MYNIINTNSNKKTSRNRRFFYCNDLFYQNDAATLILGSLATLPPSIGAPEIP